MTYRQTILEVATELFAERGLENTSVAELSKRSGAAEGTIFHHFKNKEELFLAVLQAAREAVSQRLDVALADGEGRDGLEQVEGLLEAYFVIAEEMPQLFRLLFQNHPHRLASVNDACRQNLEAIYDAFLSPLVVAIEVGVADGSIRHVEARSQALVIFAMIEGVVRFRLFELWPSTGGYLVALSFCRRSLTTSLEERC